MFYAASDSCRRRFLQHAHTNPTEKNFINRSPWSSLYVTPEAVFYHLHEMSNRSRKYANKHLKPQTVCDGHYLFFLDIVLHVAHYFLL